MLLKKRKLKSNFYTKLALFYYEKMHKPHTLKINHKNKLLFFSIYIHRKLMYYRFYNKYKFFIFSNGQLFKQKGKKFKAIKKSYKSYPTVIGNLQKRLNGGLSNIFMFFCKNYTYRSYYWLKKLFFLFKPQIDKFIITKSWNFVFKGRRRIKRKIWLDLSKNNNLV